MGDASTSRCKRWCVDGGRFASITASGTRSTLVAVVDPHVPVSLWEPFRVTLDLDRVHLFDLATGRALD